MSLRESYYTFTALKDILSSPKADNFDCELHLNFYISIAKKILRVL